MKLLVILFLIKLYARKNIFNIDNRARTFLENFKRGAFKTLRVFFKRVAFKTLRVSFKTKISVRKLKMAQQDSFRKIYSTKALDIKNPTKNLLPVRPPLFYRCKMTRTEQFIDTRLISDGKKEKY